MTLDEAMAEAHRRWGERGFLAIDGGAPELERRLVGSSDRGALGKGATWEEAFADAERTEAPEQEVAG